jgi:hypothetical protein
MMIRVVLLFLIVVLVLGMIGKLRLPQTGRRGPRPAVEATRKCPDCDAYVLGQHPAPCERPDCRYRSADG